MATDDNTITVLSPTELAVVVKVLRSTEVQNLIGAEKWDLTDAEEEILWAVIRKMETWIIKP